MFSKKIEKQVKVDGMHCMHCAKKVEDALKQIKGVKKVSVNLQNKTVDIVSKTEIDNQQLVSILQDLGYSVID